MSKTQSTARPMGGPVGGGRHGMSPGQKPAFNPATGKRLLSYIGQKKLRLGVVLFCIILSAAAGAISSLFIKTLIDDFIAPLLLDANPDFSGLFRVLMMMAAIYGAGIGATLIYNWLMVGISQGVLKQIRDDMFQHMQSLPIRYFDTRTHGDIMSHYTNDTDTLRQMISQSFPQILSSICTIVAVLAAMLSISVWLTLFALLFVFFTMKVVGVLTNKSGMYFIKHQSALADLNGYIEEMINGQKVIKVFCHEEKAREAFDRKNETLRENATAANTFANILMPVMGNMGYILYVLIAVIGGALAISGVTNLCLTGFNVLTLGMIASFLQLSRNFIMPISQVSQQLSSIIMAMAGAERIFQLMDEQSERDEGTVTLVNAAHGADGTLEEADHRTGLWAWKQPREDGSFAYTRLRGEVRFYDVDFGYDENKLVLHNISLYAKPGQKIAFVGATGAGKTTITNLINRFYDIADGKIRYDGININKIKKSDLRRSLGMVLQDVNLFTGTVMENLRYGNPAASEEECIAAAKLANADSFIRMLPQGYDTLLSGDGSGLSQGQRQLLSIARAAVADPPVMILDEATSSIDTRTEAIVQRGMDALMKGRTVFVIAHRLSTVQNANAIMVLDGGRIIERGDHDDLIREKGVYYRLYTGAFELE